VLFYQCRPGSGSEVQPVQARLWLRIGIDFHKCVYYYKKSVFCINQHLHRSRVHIRHAQPIPRIWVCGTSLRIGVCLHQHRAFSVLTWRQSLGFSSSEPLTQASSLYLLSYHRLLPDSPNFFL
jgi:hypothetical protein